MLTSWILRFLKVLAGSVIILALLLVSSSRPAVAAEGLPEKYCLVSLEGAQSASLFDQSGNMLGMYPQNQNIAMQPGSGNGSSSAEATFTLPFGTTSNRLIVLQQTEAVFTLRVTYYEESAGLGTATPRYMVVFADVPLSGMSSAMVDVDCTSEMGRMKMVVDQNGDNISDETHYPTGILTEKQILDQIAPVTLIKAETNPFRLYLTDVLIVSLEPRDTGSGVIKTEYSLDAGVTWHVYQQPFEVSADKTPVIFARSVDLAGNHEYPPTYHTLTPSGSVPTVIWVLVGLDVFFLISTLLSILYLKSMRKAQK